MTDTDVWDYTRSMMLRSAALAIFAVAAAYQYIRGFIEGVLESRETYLLSKDQPPPPPPFVSGPYPGRTTVQYTVEMDPKDGEVLLNGLPIGNIQMMPWQFCSYDQHYGNGPARDTPERAFDDACDYAESVARTS